MADKTIAADAVEGGRVLHGVRVCAQARKRRAALPQTQKLVGVAATSFSE